MQSHQIVNGPPDRDLPPVVPIDVDEVFLPIKRHLRAFLVCAILGIVGGTVAGFVRPLKYDARVTLMVISSTKTGNVPEGIAGALLAISQTGVEATPTLLMKFADFNSVLMRVATTRGPRPRTQMVVEQLKDGLVKENQSKWTKELRRRLDVSSDKQTGIVYVRMMHRDSALARFVVSEMVDAIRDAFMAASKGQASALRHAQEVRVDSATRRLRMSEQQLINFTASNRTLSLFSSAHLRRQDIEREMQLAQTLYMQAASDMESARSKELEQTPAVMVVDSIPPFMPREPRRAWLWGLLGGIAGVVIGASVAYLAYYRASRLS